MREEAKSLEKIDELVSRAFEILRGKSRSESFDSAAWLISLFAMRAIEHLVESKGEPRIFLADSAMLSGVSLQSQEFKKSLLEAFSEMESSIPNLDGVFENGLLSNTSIRQRSYMDDDPVFRDLVWLFYTYSFPTEDSNENLSVSRVFQTFLNSVIIRLPMIAGALASPPGLAELVAKVANSHSGDSVYDPVCGTGGFLAASARLAAQDHGVIRVYGRDNDSFAAAVARLNMFFLGLPGQVVLGDSLGSEVSNTSLFGRFDCVLGNPPFAGKVGDVASTGRRSGRAKFRGVMNTELAVLDHMIDAAGPTGKIVALIPNGVLFKGGQDMAFRIEIVKQGLVSAIIALPAGIFYGTTISASLLILEKGRDKREPILFIDGSQESSESRAIRILPSLGAEKIASTYLERSEIQGFSVKVPVESLEEGNFDLSVSRYVIPQTNRTTLDTAEEFGKLQRQLERQSNLIETLSELLSMEGIRADK